MKIITLTKDNLEQEHICCAISNNKDEQVIAKKKWLATRLDDGLVFKKVDVRGKCFIEYIPAEKAWCPIDAPDWIFINCFWVSGQFKSQGLSNLLLAECIQDSQAKKGLVILSAKKKMPFLSDPSYLEYKAFKQADEFDPYYRLMYLPFQPNEQSIPKFKASLKKSQVSEQSFVLYYSHQCPFTVKYVPLIEKIAQAKKIPFKTICLESCEQAQNSPAVFSSYSLFYNGKFITNEILSAAKFEKLIENLK